MGNIDCLLNKSLLVVVLRLVSAVGSKAQYMRIQNNPSLSEASGSKGVGWNDQKNAKIKYFKNENLCGISVF